MTSSECVFCGRVGRGEYQGLGDEVGCFEPLNPVTPGHLLVIPLAHTPNAAADPGLAAKTMRAAAEQAGKHEAANIITSIGREATQTIEHLHLHVVPRRAGDGLSLPWTARG